MIMQLEHISKSFGGRQLFHDVTFRLEEYERLALVGPNGAGKTTLVSLLLRFYTPQSGTITIDGLPIQQYTRDGLRRRLAIVLQDGWLCGGTIAENIAYGVPGAHVEQVINAADVANAHEFIARQPDAYDSMLGERGVGLSGGEKQRISIARAVLMNPSILIFDEATAAVDSETENLIQEAIERLISGRTTLMIAHRLSTLRKANKIIVVDQGRIIECGSHDELMALGGKYHRLIEIQSMSEKLRKSKEEERFD